MIKLVWNKISLIFLVFQNILLCTIFWGPFIDRWITALITVTFRGGGGELNKKDKKKKKKIKIFIVWWGGGGGGGHELNSYINKQRLRIILRVCQESRHLSVNILKRESSWLFKITQYNFFQPKRGKTHIKKVVFSGQTTEGVGRVPRPLSKKTLFFL